MNTRIIYNIKIKTIGAGSGCTIHTKLEELEYKNLLDQIETRKFITVIDTNQDPITIKVDNICNIYTKIEVESDMYIAEEE